jgi:GxxExxY protein
MDQDKHARKDAKAQRMTENEIGKIVVDSAIAEHRALGPGLLESVYEIALAHELSKRGLEVKRQEPVSIEYDGLVFDQGFRADIIVNNRVVLELKSVEKTTAAHRKQIQTYLRLSGHKLGFLLNFGEALMKNGITRAVNGLEDE